MKSFRSALLLTVCLALAGNVPVYAGATSHSGTSSSFKSGFSSQKSNAARHSQAVGAARQPPERSRRLRQAPGSPASAAAQYLGDVARCRPERVAANALKTLDERRAAANQPLPPLNDTPAPAAAAVSPSYRAPAYPAPGPGYQQQPSGSGNGLMAGVMGFMLGRAMSQSHQPVAYPTTSGNQPATQPAATTMGTDSDGRVTGMPGLGVPAAARRRRSRRSSRACCAGLPGCPC